MDPAHVPVLLIGPVNAGKSTIAPLLAARLGIDHISLDDVCWDYFADAGYDRETAREWFQRGRRAPSSTWCDSILTVYTKDKSPEATCEEIISRLT